MEAMELGQRAVRCKHWRWMPGMRDRGGNVYLGRRANAPAGVHQWARLDGGTWEWSEAEIGLPDFNDAATLGCLAALVREVHRFNVVIQMGDGWWCVETARNRWDDDDTNSFAEALVVALKVAP